MGDRKTMGASATVNPSLRKHSALAGDIAGLQSLRNIRCAGTGETPYPKERHFGGQRADILGCPFDPVDMEEAAQFIRECVIAGRRAHITVGNVDMVMKARRDPRFAELFWKSQLTIVDGAPILWASALLKRPLKARVPGVELTLRCAGLSQETGCGVALVGAERGIAEAAARNMARRFPGSFLHVIPTPHPLREADDRAIIDRIRENGDRIVLVALGAPRQEFWVAEHLAATGANVGIGVGGAFDIISETRPRAPAWMRNHGLEWLHRMRLEPRRLARRYLIEDLPFLGILLKEWLFQPWTGWKRGNGSRDRETV